MNMHATIKPLPHVSVIMSVYNNAPYLDAAIDSILKQSFHDFEFLILNDGSTDGSEEKIDAWANRDSRIRPLHQENRGFIYSLNRLLTLARAPILARMDGDDISMPDRFQKQIDWLDAHRDHGAVGTWQESIDEHGAVMSGETQTPATHAEVMERVASGPLGYNNNIIMHSSLMVRRTCMDAVGGYHAAFRHCEDYDLWLRLTEVTKLGNIPEKLVQYRRYAGQVSQKHLAEQATNALIAHMAYKERAAGKPDPLSGHATMPPLDDLDALFGPGTAKAIRAQIVPLILYSPSALAGDAFAMMLRHVKDGGDTDGLWRTVARLAKLGEPRRSARLALALLGA